MAGYSGTPLAQKLGIRPGMKVLAVNAPKDYRAILGALPEGVSILAKSEACEVQLVHLFVRSLKEFDDLFSDARRAMATDGAIWVSWYKKAAKIETDVTEDAIRSRALKTDLVDVKVCAVNDIWSGLKLVVRKHLR
jgi:Protein of unknown function (DUF3052)